MRELVAEATRKSGLIWITVDGGRAEPVWHHWHAEAAYVLAGGSERPLRCLADAERVAVAVRSKTTGGRLLTWQALVVRVPAGSEEWDEVIPELQATRLNPPDGRAAPQRWARECVLLRLEPTGELLDLPDGSGAAPPAITSGPLPFAPGRKRPRSSS